MNNKLTDKITQKLKEKIKGKIITDTRLLKPYSRDQSMYQIYPLAVIIPEALDDILNTVKFSFSEGISFTPRSGGSGTAGGALGRGIVLAFPKKGPLNKILDFDLNKIVTAEAGLLHNNLQDFLKKEGYYLPSDPSSGNLCFIGGNVATKASGPHALKHGSIDRYIKSLRFITVRGEKVDTAGPETIPHWIKEEILSLSKTILSDKETVKRLEERKNRKIASGYNLFTFIKDKKIEDIITQLIVGSVGTLGVVTGASLRCEPYIPEKATMLLYFQDLYEGGEAVKEIKALNVAAIEIMNDSTIKVIKERNPDMNLFDTEAHMMLVEFEGEERFSQIEKVKEIVKKYRLLEKPRIADDMEEQEKLWKVRKSVFPTLRNYRPGLRPLSLVNDIGIDDNYLADFIRDVESVFRKHNLVASIYGHAGSGNLHLRPLFDIKDKNLRKKLLSVADDVYDAVFKYDGTITAEHGMGRLRAPYLEKEWGKKIISYMKKIKNIFDPDDILNPEAMFSERDVTEDMISF